MMGDLQVSDTPLERDIFNKHFDHFLATGQINPEILEQMDSYQQYAVNTVKKAFKRMKHEDNQY